MWGGNKNHTMTTWQKRFPPHCHFTIFPLIYITHTHTRHSHSHGWSRCTCSCPLWRPCERIFFFFFQAWVRPHWLWGMERRNWWFHVWLSEPRTPFLCFCKESRRENKLERSNSHSKRHSKWKMNEYSQFLNINLLYPMSERASERDITEGNVNNNKKSLCIWF